MFQRLIKVLLLITVITALLPGGFILAARDDDPNSAYPYQQGNIPITTYFTSSTNVSTLDPARGEDVLSINWIENLFLGLTNNNPLNSYEILPELATSW